MGLFTLRRLASLQMWLAVTTFFGLLYMLGLNIFEKKIDCKLDEPGQKSEMDEKFSFYYRNSSDALEIRQYQANQFIWFFLLIWMYLSALMGSFYVGKRNPKPTESSFTRASALGYVITSFLFLILPFAWFPFTLSGDRFASFAIVWLRNFSDGKPLFARQVTCEFPRYQLFKPVTETTATCRLPMNSHFEFIYLVLWFWFVLLAVVNLLVLVQSLLYAFSSTLRLKRLSALLKGVDKQKISELAQDPDNFFKIECCTGETVELKGQQLLDVAPLN